MPSADQSAQIPVQVINLDRRPDRLAQFTEQATRAGITFERFQACDGTLPEYETRAAQIPVTPRGEVVGPYALACLDSQRGTWKRFLETGADYGAVFEDDVYLSPDLAKAFTDLSWFPADADVVRLETMNYRSVLARTAAGQVAGRGVYRLYTSHMGLGGYVLSRKGAERMLAGSETVTDTIDRMVFDMITPLSRSLFIYQVSPALCVQSSFADQASPDWGKSDINVERYSDAKARDANGFPVIAGLRQKLPYLAARIRKVTTGQAVALMRGGKYQHIPFAERIG